MAQVERMAQFTVEEMRGKLELKQQGKCECKATDILCKTMCGTLLGPGAVDATPGAARPLRQGTARSGERRGACRALRAARRGRLHAAACGIRYMRASVSIATTRSIDQ